MKKLLFLFILLTSLHSQSATVLPKHSLHQSERIFLPAYVISDTSHHGEIKYYTNRDGDKVQSPTTYDQVPDGATAVCRDGTYSFSENRRGTCSHHGGVAKWLQ
jgi:uncharacterized protein DUF3761